MIELASASMQAPMDDGELGTVLHHVSLSVARGERLGVLGTEGSGKTSLLELIRGAAKPSEGTVRRDLSVSWPVASAPRILQRKKTGYGNLRFLAGLYGRPFQQVERFVAGFAPEALNNKTMLEEYDREVGLRLAFAATLALGFQCLLVDEIISSGPRELRQECRELLRAQLRGGRALVYTSERPDDLAELCDRFVMLHAGRIVETGRFTDRTGWRIRFRNLSEEAKEVALLKRRRRGESGERDEDGADLDEDQDVDLI